MSSERLSYHPSQSRFMDRDPIHNIWDQEDYFNKIKSTIINGAPQSFTQEIEATGKSLLDSDDPYQVKIGILLLRLCIWDNQPLAEEWVNEIAPDLMTHSHPRIRHSTLWNVRSSIWQDEALAEQGIKLARNGLHDGDPAVQRVAIWTHGDAVLNNEDLYIPGLESIKSFIQDNPKESNQLFALEEFFMPLRKSFKDEDDYKEAIIEMRNQSRGYPGVNARCSNILGEDYSISIDDREDIHQRLLTATSNTGEMTLIKDRKYKEAMHQIVKQISVAQTFIDRMKRLWIVRDLSWMDDSVDLDIFQQLSSFLSDTRDGDLIRTTSVVIADHILKFPVELADQAIETAERFFNESDIDGSQIVVAQTLTALRDHNSETKSKLLNALPSLYSSAANRSVSRTLDNLKN